MLAGLHVPVIPSFDVEGSAGTVLFWQYEFAIVGKVGETMPTIVMFKEAGFEQLPADGVNVYTVLPAFAVLIEEVFQVPSIPSVDVSGSAGAISFRQYASAMVGNVGDIVFTIVMFIEASVAQLPGDDGVNW